MCAISLLLKILLCLIVACYVGKIEALNNSMEVNSTSDQVKEKTYDVLQNWFKFAIKNNTIGNEENEKIPTEAFNGIYTDCVMKFSFPCLQKKLIVFLEKLEKMKNIKLFGKTLLWVRKSDEPFDTTNVMAKAADHVDQAYLKDIIDNLIEKFFNNHSLRVKVPDYFEDPADKDGEETYVDIDFSSKDQLNEIGETRKRKHGKFKGMKKVMMMIGLVTCLKLTMMGPFMVGLLGLKTMKALMMAMMSLAISKMMFFSRFNLPHLFGGHHPWGGWGGWGGFPWFGGHHHHHPHHLHLFDPHHDHHHHDHHHPWHHHDWHTAPHGWDRNLQETPVTSTLNYNIDPPASYSSYTARSIN